MKRFVGSRSRLIELMIESLPGFPISDRIEQRRALSASKSHCIRTTEALDAEAADVADERDATEATDATDAADAAACLADAADLSMSSAAANRIQVGMCLTRTKLTLLTPRILTLLTPRKLTLLIVPILGTVEEWHCWRTKVSVVTQTNMV